MEQITQVSAANEQPATDQKFSELFSCYQMPDREYSDCLKKVVKLLNRKYS